MSKSKNGRYVAENSALAKLSNVRVSPRKLNLVAQLIRGKNIMDAMNALKFCEKRISKDVKQLLNSAVANAENNHNLDVDRLIVTEASVGNSMTLRRIDIKGRSRRGIIRKPYANMRLVVSEVEAV